MRKGEKPKRRKGINEKRRKGINEKRRKGIAIVMAWDARATGSLVLYK